MADPAAIGAELGGYRLTEQIGQGGMGIVYRGEHAQTGRVAAVKVLTPELQAEPGFRTRFEREAEYAGSMNHPNVIPLFGAGEQDGVLYMAMQYVEGSDLKTLLANEGRLSAERAVSLLTQVAAALDHAHATGLLHRDVKPGNVMIAAGTGQCYLTDFGLSKNPSQDSFALTAAGSFVGTIDYTAPEQILAKPFDYRVDVYSLACVLFEALTGEVPYPKARDVEVLYAHIQDPPPRLTERRPDLPPAIDDVIAKAMAKKPEQRYASCGELMQAAAAALAVVPAPPSVPEPAPPAPPVGEPLAAAGEALLRVVMGKAQGTEIRIEGDFLIGRHAEGEGKLGRDPEISRKHALLRLGDSGLTVEDLGSTNGTFVNDARVAQPHPLRPGDRISVGDTVLVVEAIGMPEPPAAAEAPAPAPGPGATLFAPIVTPEEAPAHAPAPAGAEEPAEEVADELADPDAHEPATSEERAVPAAEAPAAAEAVAEPAAAEAAAEPAGPEAAEPAAPAAPAAPAPPPVPAPVEDAVPAGEVGAVEAPAQDDAAAEAVAAAEPPAVAPPAGDADDDDDTGERAARPRGKVTLRVEIDLDTGGLTVGVDGGSGVRIAQDDDGRWTIEPAGP